MGGQQLAAFYNYSVSQSRISCCIDILVRGNALSQYVHHAQIGNRGQLFVGNDLSTQRKFNAKCENMVSMRICMG